MYPHSPCTEIVIGECKPGYTHASGSVERECIAHNVWSGSDMVCDKLDLCIETPDMCGTFEEGGLCLTDADGDQYCACDNQRVRSAMLDDGKCHTCDEDCNFQGTCYKASSNGLACLCDAGYAGPTCAFSDQLDCSGLGIANNNGKAWVMRRGCMQLLTVALLRARSGYVLAVVVVVLFIAVDLCSTVDTQVAAVAPIPCMTATNSAFSANPV